MYHNKMKIEILSKSENESFARVVVSAFAAQLDPTIEEITDIKTAISEAVTNAIIHGYEEEEDKIVTLEASIDDMNLLLWLVMKAKVLKIWKWQENHYILQDQI